MNRFHHSPKICIIGAGISGLCAAIKLREELGVDTFTLFEAHDDVGGTWLMNIYPGCASDVPSQLYSFSFEPNPYWSQIYANQKEILEYLRGVAKKYELYPKIKFNHIITKCAWDANTTKWHVVVQDVRGNREERMTFDIVISAIGAFRIPSYPEEFATFEKPTMHSAQWNSSVELKDKVVAVVGCGASAVQIIPEIVDKVKRLIVYQRTPVWVLPKFQMSVSDTAKWAFAKVPGLAWVFRLFIFGAMDLTHFAMKADTVTAKIVKAICHWQLNRKVTDAELKKKLTPNHELGCRNLSLSDDYYEALCKANVTVVTSPIAEVTKDTIVNKDGSVETPDVLILATGFDIHKYSAPLETIAKDGKILVETWKKNGFCAYAGIVCNLLPNCFMILGPNSAVAHNSLMFSIECQVNWIIQVIREMLKRNARTTCVKKSAEEEYMKEIHSNLKSTVWVKHNCGSWIMDGRGVVSTLWPDTLTSYWRKTRTVDYSIFDFGK